MVRTALISRIKRRSLPQLLAATAVDAAAAAARTDSATVFIIRLRQLHVFHVAKCITPACKRYRAEIMLDLCSSGTCIYSANLHKFDFATADFVRNVDVARESLPEIFHRDIRSSK